MFQPHVPPFWVYGRGWNNAAFNGCKWVVVFFCKYYFKSTWKHLLNTRKCVERPKKLCNFVTLGKWEPCIILHQDWILKWIMSSKVRSAKNLYSWCCVSDYSWCNVSWRVKIWKPVPSSRTRFSSIWYNNGEIPGQKLNFRHAISNGPLAHGYLIWSLGQLVSHFTGPDWSHKLKDPFY